MSHLILKTGLTIRDYLSFVVPVCYKHYAVIFTYYHIHMSILLLNIVIIEHYLGLWIIPHNQRQMLAVRGCV